MIIIEDPLSNGKEAILAPSTVKARGKASFPALRSMVEAELNSFSWWQLHGEDWLVLGAVLFLVLPIGLLFMRSSNPLMFASGFVAVGFVYHTFFMKASHSFSHRSMGVSERLNHVCLILSGEVIGGFPYSIAMNAHIKVHHPHTNIIGYGDSSTWKMPFLSSFMYMFVAPVLLPIITPLVGIRALGFRPARIVLYMVALVVGYSVHYQLLHTGSGLSPIAAVICLYLSRGIFMVPYIHVNIFQHIGLNMYEPENRPDRITLMSTAVLNLPRNVLLDYCFGHSIISCHLEHHLFPNLPDRMCLQVKHIVKKFIKENGLVYHEKTYVNRMHLFVKEYEMLMRHAPPITEFVAVQ